MTVVGRSIFTGRPVSVEIEGSRIREVREGPDEHGLPSIAPAFIDLQVNGYRGLDYSSPSFSLEEVEQIIRYLAASGTARHLPTIITSPQETIVRNLAILAKGARDSDLVGRAIPGYHIEGPFISPEDGPRGAHSRQHVRNPDFDEFRAWQEAAEGRVKIVTVAPELPGALGFIERVADSGVLVAIGHTAAAPETVRDAIRAGARLSTHLGNGSHATIPRLKNYIWEQLAADELSAGMISDGFHLPAAVVKSIARGKGLDRLFLVSDVSVHGGQQPGIYRWGDIACEVFEDGHLGLHGHPGFLAGAGHLLDRDVVFFAKAAGVELAQAVRLCTESPARLLGIAVRPFPSIGETADITLFDYQRGDESLTIRRTVGAGQLLYESR